MKRREFITVLGGAGAAVPMIGYLGAEQSSRFAFYAK
jgi:hypothetical protein